MLVDVSHVVENGMITYKGLPPPLVQGSVQVTQNRVSLLTVHDASECTLSN
jgi:kynurenine formamidase